MNAHQGYLYSPNYPKNYPSNASCEWTIQVDPAYTLQFYVEDLGMIKSPNCSKDYLRIYDGTVRDETKLLLNLCDSDANVTSVLSNGNQLLVVFQSDETMEAKGFRANYSTVSQPRTY